MQCKIKHTTLILTVLLALIILLLSVKPCNSTTTYNWKWSPNVHFKLPAYNTIIAFSNWIYMDSFTWNSINATQITFNNIKMDGDTLSIWSVSVENANLTVNSFFKDNKLIFTVSAPFGTISTTKVYCGDRGKPLHVSGAMSWNYDSTTKICTVKAVHYSPVTITLDWVIPKQVLNIFRNNYYFMFSLLSLAPLCFAAIMLFKIIKGGTLESEEIIVIVILITSIIVGFIIIQTIVNTIFG